MPSISGAKAPGLQKAKTKQLRELLGRGFGACADFGGGPEAFVIGVFDGDADVNGAGVEPKRVVGVCVGGNPEVAKKIFAVGGEVSKTILVVFGDDIRHGFAVGFDDLKIVVVDPNAAFEIALLFLDDFGNDVKDVGGEVVDFLAADVGDVVFGQLVAGEREGLDLLEVFFIFVAHLNSSERVGGGVDDFFIALPFRRKENVALDFVVAVGYVVGVERLHLEILRPGVGAEKLFELRFLSREFLNDLIGRERRRLFGDGSFLGFARGWLGFDGAGSAGSGAGGRRGRERARGLSGKASGEEKRGEGKRETKTTKAFEKTKQTRISRNATSSWSSKIAWRLHATRGIRTASESGPDNDVSRSEGDLDGKYGKMK